MNCPYFTWCSSCCCKNEEDLETGEEVDLDAKIVKQKVSDANDIDIIIPQFKKVPLEKIFKSPRVPIQMHPQISKMSQDSLSEYTSEFSPKLRHIVHPELRKQSLITEQQTFFKQVSVFSFTEPSDKPLLEFMLYYDFQKRTLTVTLIQATNLPAKHKSGTSDPFVTLFLLPHKEDIYRSKTRYKTLNPIFDESFTFEGMQYDEVMERTLVLRVFDADTFSRCENIGTIIMPLYKTELHGVVVTAVLNKESSIPQVIIISICLCIYYAYIMYYEMLLIIIMK